MVVLALATIHCPFHLPLDFWLTSTSMIELCVAECLPSSQVTILSIFGSGLMSKTMESSVISKPRTSENPIKSLVLSVDSGLVD